MIVLLKFSFSYLVYETMEWRLDSLYIALPVCLAAGKIF